MTGRPELRIVNGDGASSGLIETGGGPPHDGGMEDRLTKLESVIPTLATKVDVEGLRTDLHKMDASIVRWMIATVLTLFLGFAGLFFTMQNSINGALDRTARSLSQPAAERQVPQSTQPIIIQMPSQAAPTPAQTP